MAHRPLPSSWDASGRSSALRYLQVSGTRAKYVGPGGDDHDAAAVRANMPTPLDCPIYYWRAAGCWVLVLAAHVDGGVEGGGWEGDAARGGSETSAAVRSRPPPAHPPRAASTRREVEVVSKGRDGFIGVGFSAADVKLDRLPGWEPRSYGYHGDDGHAFSGRGQGRPYGPTFTTGDWIGVVLNRVEATISFHKRGYDLGVAFENVPPDERLYPSVGFRTPDEEIVANFGTDLAAHPFRGDVARIREEATQRLHARLLAQRLPPAGKASPSLCGELVFGFLCHHGHWASAAAVAHDVLGGAVQVAPQDVASMRTQQQINESILRGDVDTALALAALVAPGALEARPRVLFRLRCQKFIGLDAAALEYGRATLVPGCSAPEDRKLLDSALALLAYDDPAASPSAHLLSPAYLADLAAAVGGALRAARGREGSSALERCWRQAAGALAELQRAGDPGAQLLDLPVLLERPGDEG
eukprot:scaffold22.g6148.t1